MKTSKSKRLLLTAVTTLFLALTLSILSPVTADAATKPAAVTKVQKTSATANSITLKIKRVRSAKGYEVRVCKTNGKKVKTVKTTKTVIKVKGLTAGTKYKFRVRAYAKSGKKTLYGKAKNVSYKTTKKTTGTNTPAQSTTPTPTDSTTPTTPNDSNQTENAAGIYYPGESPNTGAALQADYDAYKAYIIDTFRHDANATDDNLLSSSLSYYVGGGDKTGLKRCKPITENSNYTTLLEVYKYSAGTRSAIDDLFADILTTAGYTVERIDPDDCRIRYDLNFENINGCEDIQCSMIVTNTKNERHLLLTEKNTYTNGIVTCYNPISLTLRDEWRCVVADCPHCGTEMTKMFPRVNYNLYDANMTCPTCGISYWADATAHWDDAIEGRPYHISCPESDLTEYRTIQTSCPHCGKEFTRSCTISKLPQFDMSTPKCENCKKYFHYLNYTHGCEDFSDVPPTWTAPSYATPQDVANAITEENVHTLFPYESDEICAKALAYYHSEEFIDHFMDRFN